MINQIDNLNRANGVITDLSPLKSRLIASGYVCDATAFDVFNDARVVARVRGKAANEVYVYGEIADDYMHAVYSEFGIPSVSGASFRSALNALSDDDIVIRVNSPGGYVSEAGVMLQALAERRADGGSDRVVIDGAAASAASMIAMSSGDITMARLGFIYVHEPVMTLHGSYYASDLLELTETLEGYKPQLVKTYDSRPVNYRSLGVAGMSELMRGKNANGTKVFADAALESNMIDRIEGDQPTDGDSPSTPVDAANAAKRTAANLRLRLEMHAWAESEKEKSR